MKKNSSGDSSGGVDKRMPLPGPRAKKLISTDKDLIMQSFSRWYPLVVDHGEGMYVYDVDDNKFLDFNAGIAVMALGHANQAVINAITLQAKKLIHYSFTDFLYEPALQLARRLQEIAPNGPKVKTYFGNSGAEANEAMIKSARWSTRRQYVVANTGAFHGRTYGAMTLSASKPVQRRYFGPLLPGVEHVPFPYCYRCPFKMSPDSCDLYCVDFLEEQVFEKYLPPEEVALFMTEPIQGEAGYIPAPDGYLPKLKRLLDKYGILLGVDEVQSGMGRTGAWFAVESSGIKPDYVSVAKALAGGLPLGALIGRSELMGLDAGSHASTFGGNPVSCAAGCSVIDQIRKRKLLEHVKRSGEVLMSRMRELQTRHEHIGDVRGRGLMIGVELVKDPVGKDPDRRGLEELITNCWKRGLAVIGCGASTLRLAPPLIVQNEHIDQAVDILDQSFIEVYS
ncbi:MAG: acetyl ornithine aminotransferase family protein [Candidatus Marsarchaeota archaeon]|nr:acetyl ornithine aminotransferase family protein [Candidatus Marsarchaeota archaeon]